MKRFLLAAIIISAVATAAWADTYIKLGLHQMEQRLYTGDGNWDPYANKAECAASGNDLVVGVAVSGSASVDFMNFCDSTEFTDAILCNSATGGTAVGQGYTLLFGSGDDRRDVSLGDWAPNLVKGECGPKDGLTGLGQFPGPKGAAGSLESARCAPIVNNHGAVNCAVRDFRNGNNRESTFRGDWDYGYIKGECGPGRYVKGIAHGVGNHGCGLRAVAILCCSPS
jgi:hypothetical protein